MAYILLIEDEPDLREELRSYLVRRGHTVRDIGRIAGAREAIAEREPDVVVSDINLPDGDGAAFCLEHAARYPRAKWLVMSGDLNAAHRAQQPKRDAGAPTFSVINKPVSPRVLNDFVSQGTMPERICGISYIAAPQEI